MQKENEPSLYMKEIATPVGRLCLVASNHAIKAVLWEVERQGRVRLSGLPKRVRSHPLLDRAERQLEEYFEGKRTSFELPLDPEGTPFQKSAWQALLQIPYGRTFSYQEQAARLGCPKKARAVGAANGRNPISIIVPCHRVLGKSGELTGFAGGIELKRQLLNLEAARPSSRRRSVF